MNRAPFRTPFGTGCVVYDGENVIRVQLPGPEACGDHNPARVPAPARDLVRRLERYFSGAGPLPAPGDLVEVAGTTELQLAIYRIVARIPAGTTMTYGEVAAAAGRPKAARAVGTAMARNPYPPLIPCHRVVAADGGLGGYAGGLDMKRALLAMEQRDA